MKEFLALIATALAYGLIYASIHAADPTAFGFESILDPFYFSFTTMSTVGYGDFGPKTNFAKLVVMSQQLLLIGEVIGMLGLDKKNIPKPKLNMAGIPKIA